MLRQSRACTHREHPFIETPSLLSHVLKDALLGSEAMAESRQTVNVIVVCEAGFKKAYKQKASVINALWRLFFMLPLKF